MDSSMFAVLDGSVVEYINTLDFSQYAEPKKSSTEKAFEAMGTLFMEEAYGGRVVCMLYEWMSFNLPSSVYTPDFAVFFEDGRLVFVEVKGSKKQNHYKLGRYKVRIVASLNPFFGFCMATPEPSSRSSLWDIDKIPAEPRMGSYLIYLATKGYHGNQQ